MISISYVDSFFGVEGKERNGLMVSLRGSFLKKSLADIPYTWILLNNRSIVDAFHNGHLTKSS